MGLGAISAKLKKTLTMDKKRINKNKRLTIREFGLVGDGGSVDVGRRHFYSKKNLLKKAFDDVDELVIRRVSS